MTSREIEMCVADCLQDDEIESVDSILRTLNHEYGSSWQTARGRAFTAEEVRSALDRLMTAGQVKPYCEQPPLDGCRPIPSDQVGTAFPWDDVWFHLEQSGRDAVREWWEAKGREKFPLEP